MGSCRRDCCMSLCEHLQCREHKATRSCDSLLATRRKGWLNCAGGSSTNGLRVPPSPRVRPRSHSSPRMVRQWALGRGSPVSQGSVSRAKRQDMGTGTALQSALLEDSRRTHARPRSRSPPSLCRVVIQSTTPCLVSSTRVATVKF